jgi:ribosomal RNA-processing protein 7
MAALERENAKKKRDEPKDFYRFQVREGKKAEAGELQRKFDEDRRKLDAMKQKRKGGY